MKNSRSLLRLRAEAELELRRRHREREQVAPPIWTPYPDSPQERAIESLADITGYGGQAGGGKSDWLLGLASTKHRRSIIFRREYATLKGLVRRSREIFTGHGSFNGSDLIWKGLPGDREVEFGAAQHEHDVSKFQGFPHDLIGFDEVPHFLESQVWFLAGWNRTTIEGQRCRVAMTFNPPTNSSERWIMAFFAPWLDRKHRNPAMPGELRWFARVDGKDAERPDGEPFEHETGSTVELIQPLSRTFFPAKLADNPVLARTNYRSVLQSMPEPLRSQLLYGDFDAGVMDDQWQVIPTAWVVAAMARWRDLGGDDYRTELPLTATGMDVAHGGGDQTVLARRWADFVGRLLVYPGHETPDGKSAAALMVAVHEPGALINVDAIGYGAPAYEKLSDPLPEGYGIETVHPVNFGDGSNYTDRSGRFKCVNKRAEAYWRLRDALDPENDATLALPDDPELLADLTAPIYQITPSGIKIEKKDEIKARIGRSPDRGDAVTLCLMPEPGTAIVFY